jgi:hypothetical protein
MSATWRERFAPLIRQVLDETAGKPEAEIRKALRDAWPKLLGERAHYPYKAWLAEIKNQRKRAAAKVAGEDEATPQALFAAAE